MPVPAEEGTASYWVLWSGAPPGWGPSVGLGQNDHCPVLEEAWGGEVPRSWLRRSACGASPAPVGPPVGEEWDPHPKGLLGGGAPDLGLGASMYLPLSRQPPALGRPHRLGELSPKGQQHRK